MHRFFPALAILLVTSSCRDRAPVEAPPRPIELPTMTVHADPDGMPMLVATISNPSGSELSIPGFEGDVIYGSYWYQGDEVINAPECGTGFWDSVIRIPARHTRKLRLPVPRAVTLEERYTVAVVYGGLGASLSAEDREKVPAQEWIRHPDVSFHCRKMETEVNLAPK